MSNIKCIDDNGKLSKACTLLLHELCCIPIDLLQDATIKQNRANWLHFPWFKTRNGGGAAVICSRIYFTSNWFQASNGDCSFGQGDLTSTKHWLLLLSHEVGHLPQARKVGYGLLNRLSYIIWFGLNYAWYGITRNGNYTDTMPLEIAADRGRKVLVELLYEGGMPYEDHPLIMAVHSKNENGVRHWLEANQAVVTAAKVLHGF